jgi:hypothetical protein
MSKSTKPRATPRAELAVQLTLDASPLPIERVQLGVKMEKRMVKVLKALAEASDMNLGEMLEDIVLHAFEGVSTFSQPAALEAVKDFKRLYGMNYDVHDGYRFAGSE